MWILQVEDVSAEAQRLSRCLTQASFPSSESILSDGDIREQETIKKATDTKMSYYELASSLLILFVLFTEVLRVV